MTRNSLCVGKKSRHPQQAKNWLNADGCFMNCCSWEMMRQCLGRRYKGTRSEDCSLCSEDSVLVVTDCISPLWEGTDTAKALDVFCVHNKLLILKIQKRISNVRLKIVRVDYKRR